MGWDLLRLVPWRASWVQSRGARLIGRHCRYRRHLREEEPRCATPLPLFAGSISQAPSASEVRKCLSYLATFIKSAIASASRRCDPQADDLPLGPGKGIEGQIATLRDGEPALRLINSSWRCLWSSLLFFTAIEMRCSTSSSSCAWTAPRSCSARHEAQGKPADGWVFPSTARDGHLEQGTAKTQHSAAIAKVNAETVKANARLQVAGEKSLPLPLRAFEPYVMRHTALTRMAPFCDAFTLARIAGHSSITITQRYCHPQADAVEAAFSRFGNRGELVTDAGHHEKQLPCPTDGQQPLSIVVA